MLGDIVEVIFNVQKWAWSSSECQAFFRKSDEILTFSSIIGYFLNMSFAIQINEHFTTYSFQRKDACKLYNLLEGIQQS